MRIALTVAVLKIISHLYSAYVSSRLQTQLNDLKADEFNTNNSKNKRKNQFLLSFFSLSSVFETLCRRKD